MKDNSNITDQLKRLVKEGLEKYSREANTELPEHEIIIERPKVKEFGDYATNSAMRLAGVFRKNPMEIAEGIKSNIPANPLISEINVARPGFINFRVTTAAGGAFLKQVLSEGENFGKQYAGKGEKVLIEFMSANPTGPLHIGHARNAILGDSIARCMEAAGYEVTREYYYNDAGVQMKKLGESLRARYLQELGRDVPLPEDGYRGEYMKDIARKMVEEKSDALAETEDTTTFTNYAAEKIIQMIDEDLKALNVNFDKWFSETLLHREGKVDKTLRILREKDMIYEKDGAWWLCSESLGDEKDRVVIKSDGEKTYLTPDIAYHEDKFERGYDLLINVFGGDHHGYVPRLKAGVQALGYDPDRLHCIVFQMVTLLKDGDTIKLSTRAGKFITLGEVVRELGVDVVRFFFLMRSADSQMTFDWQLARDHSMNNPVFYVQYAHARCCSLFKKAEELGITWNGPEQSDLSLLELPEEKDVIRVMEKFPEIVLLSAQMHEPHHVTLFLRELAGTFHTLFSSGTKDESKRFLVPDQPELTQARMTLVAGIKQTLANALQLIGIPPMESM